ncbi:mycofactocin precursor MftA [Streptomyces sp. NPDC058614]
MTAATQASEPVDQYERPAEADPAGPADQDLIEDDLLVEEVSIDGMCGVY